MCKCEKQMKIIKEIINNARAKNQAHETKYACKNITTKNTVQNNTTHQLETKVFKF